MLTINHKEQVDDRLVKMLEEVEAATIGHYTSFGAMDPKIESVLDNVDIVGPAFTIKTSAEDSTAVHVAMEMVQPGDILVIDRSGDEHHAAVGEMVAYGAKAKGVKGIVVDGPATDIPAIRELEIPVFSKGRSVITTKLRGTGNEINTTVQCGGVEVQPNDLIMADDNGVLVVKPDKVEEYYEFAKKAESKEQEKKAQLDAGVPLGRLTGANTLGGYTHE